MNAASIQQHNVDYIRDSVKKSLTMEVQVLNSNEQLEDSRDENQESRGTERA